MDRAAKNATKMLEDVGVMFSATTMETVALIK